MLKSCSGCKESKPLSEFGKNRSKPDGLSTACRACRSKYNRAYYQRTPERNSQRTAGNVTRRRQAREFVLEYLSANPCVDCGESDIVVLEFDHVRGEKLDSLSTMISRACGLDRIKKEIAKCEVRCANCHRRATAARHGGWYRACS